MNAGNTVYAMTHPRRQGGLLMGSLGQPTLGRGSTISIGHELIMRLSTAEKGPPNVATQIRRCSTIYSRKVPCTSPSASYLPGPCAD